MEVVKALLLYPKTKANTRNNVGHTPLMYAVFAGYQVAIVKALLAYVPPLPHPTVCLNNYSTS